MVRFTRSAHGIILPFLLAILLTLGLSGNTLAQMSSLSISTPLSRKLENAFRPPRGTGTPGPVNTVSGGTRKGEDEDLGRCIPGNRSLVALVPNSGIGETVAEYPTVFWYMPQTAASALEFVVRDAKVNDVYRVQYALPSTTQGIVTTPGIKGLTLPGFAALSPLTIGQDYHWQLALICDPLDRSADIVVEGWIRRVNPNQTLATPNQQTTPQDRLAQYADARLWYETLETLIELRRDRPNDPTLADAWKTLLSSVGLDVISDAPIY